MFLQLIELDFGTNVYTMDHL